MNECLVIWTISPIGRGMRFKLAQVWVRIPNGLLNSAGLESCLMVNHRLAIYILQYLRRDIYRV